MQKNEIKSKDNQSINSLINNKKDTIKEEKKTINTESTILDENEEIIGRNLPH